ncbi:predicted protein [Sclerotinia sclerotiorum 1980 UF-70]|uniref:Uncharacterized protein n=1 Tax=Sclerotinia sclerotiorum (strain ATCC 18683 / 1980 / Ss-1) TaxID=665079 RepID=A7E8W0_SCLS1|nr:predicted protein [Sclerotinia sclerotiorum 1980 UF-70]EDN96812.1 predicted protein [Sclerotinia sclerotiorum 1980 UF-70]
MRDMMQSHIFRKPSLTNTGLGYGKAVFLLYIEGNKKNGFEVVNPYILEVGYATPMV